MSIHITQARYLISINDDSHGLSFSFLEFESNYDSARNYICNEIKRNKNKFGIDVTMSLFDRMARIGFPELWIFSSKNGKIYNCETTIKVKANDI